jgi:hypothetical protein
VLDHYGGVGDTRHLLLFCRLLEEEEMKLLDFDVKNGVILAEKILLLHHSALKIPAS